jgi:hypothetical protein
MKLKNKPMKPDKLTNPTTRFPNLVSRALTRLRQRLQQDYERAYPDLREIVHLVLDEEESKAWEMSSFPHLLLPDLVEAHIAKLNLQPAETRHDVRFLRRDFSGTGDCGPAFALYA